MIFSIVFPLLNSDAPMNHNHSCVVILYNQWKFSGCLQQCYGGWFAIKVQKLVTYSHQGVCVCIRSMPVSVNGKDLERDLCV